METQLNSQTAPIRTLRYEPSLDGLRTLAVLLVAAFHSGVPWLQNGRIGVSVFFVLSGYLITSILERDGPLVAFYGRRLRRLVPAYVVFLTFMALMGPLLFALWHNTAVIWSAFYLSNYAVAYWGMTGPLTHTWSLAVEMQFYLLWPFVIRSRVRSYLPAILFAVLVFRFAGYAITEHWRGTYMTLHGNSAGLVLGSVVALYRDRLQLSVLFVWSGFAVIVISALAEYSGTSIATVVALTTAELGTAMLIVGRRSTSLLVALLEARLMVWLGQRSYAFYLWHLPIAVVLDRQFGWAATLAGTLTLGTIAAALSYRFVEVPSRKFSIDRLRRKSISV